MKDFELDKRILADCHCLGKVHNSWIMLHKDSNVRWFIIVPETDVSEWHELPINIQSQLIEMASLLGAMLKRELPCDKINIAAIGNIVSQFHLHVIGRWKTDPYWPGVVWGRSSTEAGYTEGEVDDLKKRCLECLGRLYVHRI